MVRQIISGGQTGVDRAALDVALDAGLPCGGWCPRGRRAEDGPIAAQYPLMETDSPDCQMRTRRNVEDADSTLILTLGPLEGGTALTAAYARQSAKPLMVIDLGEQADTGSTTAWLMAEEVGVLNIAGPRASKQPAIYARAYQFLGELLGSYTSPLAGRGTG